MISWLWLIPTIIASACVGAILACICMANHR